MTKKELDIVRKGVEVVRSLINESLGVEGLRGEGDIVSWTELETGSPFSPGWLQDFNKLEEYLNSRYKYEE